MNGKIGAVLVCAGKGERAGLGYNKILYPIGRKTLLDMTLENVVASEITHTVIVASECDVPDVARIAGEYAANITIAVGGATRTDSVKNGLSRLLDEFGGIDEFSCIVIHDGARPFATAELIDRCISSAKEFGSGVAAVKTVDTVRRVTADGNTIALPRAELYNIQTPQAYDAGMLVRAYESCDGAYTDDSQIFEQIGGKIHFVEGAYDNIKITSAADLLKLPIGQRVGAGYDVHRLVEGRALILGGVRINYEKGLLGHSDADVLTHAVMDALLSAAGLPDIGVLFPDTDDKYAGISSVLLLKSVAERVAACGYAVSNVSAVVIAERPKLAPHICAMRKSLAKELGIDVANINISATTAEGLGIVGRGDAIAVNAACILTEQN